MKIEDVTVVIVPGLRDHVAEHWQTLLQASLPRARTVPPLTRDKMSCRARVQMLDSVLAEVSGPVVLVAHSAGVMITVHWAAQHRRPIECAVLATPADLEEPLPKGYPDMATITANGWLPLPRQRLPFAAIVGGSRNDPLARWDRVSAMAGDWGCELVDLGHVGHLNPAAGFGPWPQATELIGQALRHSASHQ